ncbi:MAG: LemA family protein [Acidobacteria bacterium]|nr:LemA family protein [Acidobacteriota bacterium]
MLILATALVVLLAVALLYNRLVSARQRVREAWSAIDVQLQRRAALIPNLVETVKGYASFERETLQKVTEARTAAGVAAGPRAAARASEDLANAIRTLVAVAEAYPELEANERFAQLQADLADTENQIAFARNYYNGAVEIYNNTVQQLPTMLIAGPFGFQPAEFFSAEPGAAAVPTA